MHTCAHFAYMHSYMCICGHIPIYVCIYPNARMYAFIYAYMCAHMHICVHTCIHVRILHICTLPVLRLFVENGGMAFRRQFFYEVAECSVAHSAHPWPYPLPLTADDQPNFQNLCCAQFLGTCMSRVSSLSSATARVIFLIPAGKSCPVCRLANLDDRYGISRMQSLRVLILCQKQIMHHHQSSQSEWETNSSITSFR